MAATSSRRRHRIHSGRGAARISGIPLRRPPDQLRTAAQLGIGILIGTTFSPQTAVQLAHNFLPVIGAASALVASGLVLSRTLQRTLGLDTQTALLACSPAGLSQMAALSEELGAQTFIVSIFQLTRMLTVVTGPAHHLPAGCFPSSHPHNRARTLPDRLAASIDNRASLCYYSPVSGIPYPTSGIH